MSEETPSPASNEYIDRRRRKQERLLTAPYSDSNNSGSFPHHGKHHKPAIQFKISPFAEKVGAEVATLFGMSLSQYAKAVLYLNLGLVFEPIDRRKRIH